MSLETIAGIPTLVVATVAPESAGHDMMDVSSTMMIWTWVAFALMMIILYKIAWKPILKALEDREQRIRKGIDDAECARAALETAEAKASEIFQAAEAQARAHVEEARLAAQKAAQGMEGRAREESRQMVDSARREIEQATVQAREALRRESAELAIRMAERIMEAEMDVDRNRTLVTKWLQEHRS